jgi:hypothetical protein
MQVYVIKDQDIWKQNNLKIIGSENIKRLKQSTNKCNVSPESLTTERIIPSGTNSPPAEVLIQWL